MKVSRYLYGQTNISQLRDMQSNLIKSGEAAAQAAAPYQAVEQAAQNISSDLFRLQEKKIQQQDANEKIQATADMENVTSNLKLLRKQADQEKWTQEEFTTAANETIKSFVSGVDKFGDRNREKMAFIYGNEAQKLLAETELEAVDINTDRVKESWAESYDRLGATKDYQGQLMMLEVAGQEGGIQLFDPEVLNKMRREIEGQITADVMIDEYAKAKATGIEDKWLQQQVDKNYSDETWTAFGIEQKKYDALTKQIEVDLQTEKAVQVSLFTESISSDTTTDQMVNKFRELGLTDYGTLNMWINKRESAKKANEVMTADSIDPYNKSDRKVLNQFVVGATTQDKVNSAIGIAAGRRAAPQYLDTYFNQNAVNPATFEIAAENWMKYRAMADDVPLGVDADAVEKYSWYSELVVGMDGNEAAQFIREHYSGLNDKRIAANRNAYTDKAMGENGKSPSESVRDRLTELLIDQELPTLAVQRAFRVDQVPEFPPELERFIQRSGMARYGNTTNIEATASALMQDIINSGWKVTTVNDDVESGKNKLGPQWMKNPPYRDAEVTRLQLNETLRGNKFYVGNSFIEIDDPEKVEIWNYRKQVDPKTKEIVDAWTLRYDGQVMYTESGAPAGFTYATAEKEKNPVDIEAAKIIEQLQEQEKKRKTALEQEQMEVRKSLLSNTPEF